MKAAMIRLLVLLVLLCTATPSVAAVILSERDWQTLKALARGGTCGARSLSSFPYAVTVTDRDCVLLVNSATPVDLTLAQAGTNGLTAGFSFSVINLGAGTVTVTPNTSLIQGAASYDVVTNSSVSIYTDGTNYFVFAGSAAASVPGLDESFDVENVIDGATSATPFRAGDGTRGMETFGDATMGGVTRPYPLGDSPWRIWPNFQGCVLDMEASAAGTPVLCFDPDAATPKEKYAVQPGYYMLKSFYLDARKWEGDSAQCPSRPTVVTFSNTTLPTYICTENNSARLKTVVPMRNDWDGGVIYLKLYYAQTAADTGSAAFEVAAACRAPGTAFNGTYGTEVDVDDAAVTGSGAIDATLSAAVTPNGTCAAGNLLFLYWDIDATDNPTTAAATLNLVGADVFYSSTSLSH